MFGDTGRAAGYQFGLAFFEAPFYAIGKLVGALGVHSVGGLAVGPGLISLGTALTVFLTAALMVPLLGRLGLPGAGLVLLAAVFGTPLFYYGTFSTGQTQAVDTLLSTAAVVLLFLYFRLDERRLQLALALGGVFGVAMAVRYFSGTEAVALVAVLVWLRRYRDAAAVGACAAAVFGLLVLVPVGLGVGLFGGYGPAEKDIVFAPGNPIRMLFSAHRGLFVWTPVALLGAIGYVRLLGTQPSERRFLATAGAMGLGVTCSYVFFRDWGAGWSFGERYYLPLFPLIVLGLASLLEWRPRLTTAAAALAVAWTLFLATYVVYGLGFDEHRSDAFEFPARVLQGKISPRLIASDVYCGSRLRLVFPRVKDC